MSDKRKGLLFCLVGPAGGGKTTFANRLLNEFKGSLVQSISCTSRPPRPDEVSGESYHFVTREEFQAKIDSDQFYEWEEIHGNFYGTLKSTIHEVLTSGKDLLLVIDIKGAVNFKKNFPEDCIICFVLPPEFSLLEKRLKARGTIDPAEMARRLDTARHEYRFLVETYKSGRVKDIDFLVVNDDLGKTYYSILNILNTEKLRLSRLHAQIFDQLTVY